MLLSCRSSLYSLDINPVSGRIFINIFSRPIGWLFLLFHCFFCRAEAFQFDVVPLINFVLGCQCFRHHTQSLDHKEWRFVYRTLLEHSYLGTVSASKCQDAFSLCCLLGILQFQVFCLQLTPFQVNFCKWCAVRLHLHCSAYSYPVFSVPSIKETFFPHEYFWPLCQLLVGCICICRFISGLFFLFFWHMCLFLYQYHTSLVTRALYY